MVAIAIKQQEIEKLCRRWPIKELALFGSVVRDDFRPDSDGMFWSHFPTTAV